MKGAAMATTSTSQDNVLVVNFEEDANAYEALSDVKELDIQGQVDLRAAAVVVREQDGRLIVNDEVDDSRATGKAAGGIVGLLIGILGGPLGVLIGGATGLLIGSLFDVEDADDTESVLSDISRSVRAGRTALLAEVREPGLAAIDEAMGRLSGTVLRRSVEDVEAEIAAAEEAQRAAKRQARKRLRRGRRAKLNAEIRAKIAGLKAKLHRHKSTAAAST
jgi:uncharacterized membrane protein